MADPVSKLRLLQQLKLAEMLKQVSAKGYRRQLSVPWFLLLLVSSLCGTECSFRARACGGFNTSFVSKAKRLSYSFFLFLSRGLWCFCLDYCFVFSFALPDDFDWHTTALWLMSRFLVPLIGLRAVWWLLSRFRVRLICLLFGGVCLAPWCI